MSFTGDFIVDSDKFERLKIGKLRNDREAIQEKTYKNWINSILLKVCILLGYFFARQTVHNF